MVRILPFSARAKNRVREHGVVMRLMQEKMDAFRVESLDKTFRLGESMVPWGGWFTFEEADFKELSEGELVEGMRGSD